MVADGLNGPFDTALIVSADSGTVIDGPHPITRPSYWK